MENDLERALELIEGQQKGVEERSAPWMVGEQLKDICRREPRSAEILARDLEIKEMSLAEAERKIKAFADGHKTGNFACVTPAEADRILREFYGLPGPEEVPPVTGASRPPAGRGMSLDLEALLS